MIKGICLDAVGTLFRVRGSVGAIYAQAAEAFGASFSAAAVDRAFGQAFRQAPPAAFPGATALSTKELSQLERAWWRTVVQQTLALTPGGDKLQDFESYFNEVFDFFGGAAAWELYPETQAVLAHLAPRQRLGIISNFDSRLGGVLAALDLVPWFETVVISTAVGAAKPAASVFGTAVAQLGLRPEEVLHVGDSQSQDYWGAKGAGLEALWLRREQPQIPEDSPPLPTAATITDLWGIVSWLQA